MNHFDCEFKTIEDIFYKSLKHLKVLSRKRDAKIVMQVGELIKLEYSLLFFFQNINCYFKFSKGQ